MENTQIAIDIISLPEKFFRGANTQSIYSLLQDTRYFEFYEEVDESLIKEALGQQPSFIDQWFGWMESKRVDSGWYLVQDNNDSYEVGFIGNEGVTEKVKYSDKSLACASFIKKEIESIRKG